MKPDGEIRLELATPLNFPPTKEGNNLDNSHGLLSRATAAGPLRGAANSNSLLWKSRSSPVKDSTLSMYVCCPLQMSGIASALSHQVDVHVQRRVIGSLRIVVAHRIEPCACILLRTVRQTPPHDPGFAFIRVC